MIQARISNVKNAILVKHDYCYIVKILNKQCTVKHNKNIEQVLSSNNKKDFNKLQHNHIINQYIHIHIYF